MYSLLESEANYQEKRYQGDSICCNHKLFKGLLHLRQFLLGSFRRGELRTSTVHIQGAVLCTLTHPKLWHPLAIPYNPVLNRLLTLFKGR